MEVLQVQVIRDKIHITQRRELLQLEQVIGSNHLLPSNNKMFQKVNFAGATS